MLYEILKVDFIIIILNAQVCFLTKQIAVDLDHFVTTKV